MADETASSVYRTEETELKEALHLFIDEEQNKVKDARYTIFTGNGNHANIITERINGMLEGVIISTNKPVQIRITLAEFPEIILFEKVNQSGVSYIPLRFQGINSKGDGFNFSQERIALNNALSIEISGGIESETIIIMRFV